MTLSPTTAPARAPAAPRTSEPHELRGPVGDLERFAVGTAALDVADGSDDEEAIDLKGMTRSLEAALEACETRDAARAVLLRVVRQLMNPSAVHLWRVASDGRIASVNGPDLSLPHEETSQLCLADVTKAAQTRGTTITELDRRRNLVALSLPLGSPVPFVGETGQKTELTEVLTVVLLIGTEPLESFLVILQLLCGYLALWEAHAQAKQFHDISQIDNFLLKTIVQMAESGSGPAAARTCVEEVRKILPAGQIAIGIGHPETGECQLLGLSGAADIDSRSPLSRAVQSALRYAMQSDHVRRWKATEGPCAVELESLTRETGASQVLSGPLRDIEDRIVGSWLIAGDESLDAAPVARNALVRGDRAVARIVTRKDRWSRPKAGTRPSRLRAWMPLLLTLGLIGGMLAPVPYRVACEAQVQPQQRRFIAAPFAGILREVNVEAGDIVKAGAVLARMDDTELQLERTELQAEVDRLTRSRDVNRADGKEVEAVLDGHKLEQAEARLAMLESRLSNLQITSPVSGVVLSDDLKRAEGIPVRIGQSLFEVAPLDKMRVELRIPVDQIDQVQLEQSVSVALVSQPGGSLTTQVRRLLPNAETVEGQHVFLALADIPNDSESLRPGENGQARIEIGTRPLWWVLFHRPWQKLRIHWGW